jgi:hypothetical protein
MRSETAVRRRLTEATTIEGTTGERSRRSTPVLWAWLDLNQRPHPYQLNAGNRCAHRPFRRSRPTVRAEGMRSIGTPVCALIVWVGVYRYHAHIMPARLTPMPCAAASCTPSILRADPSVPPSTQHLRRACVNTSMPLGAGAGSAATAGGGADAAEWLPRQAGDEVSASSWLQIMPRSGRLAASAGLVRAPDGLGLVARR